MWNHGGGGRRDRAPGRAALREMPYQLCTREWVGYAVGTGGGRYRSGGAGEARDRLVRQPVAAPPQLPWTAAPLKPRPAAVHLQVFWIFIE